MGLAGQAKKDWEFVSYRAKKQTPIWSKLVKGETEGLDLDGLDPEILACCTLGKNFRSEGLSMEKLWLLYIGVQELTEEEEARGKKKAGSKGTEETKIEPIKARRVVGSPVLDDKSIATGEFTYSVKFHDDGYLDFPSWLFARDQARKDLLWLNREVLGNTLVIQRVHQVVCDQFVQKNFDSVYRDGYTIEELTQAIKRQNRVPTRWDEETKNYVFRSQADLDDPDNFQTLSLTQDPRDFFKSTIGRADAIQWMLACPDISMIILCADNNLAETFVSEIKKKFFLAKGGTPSALHLLFPEYVLRGVKGTSAEPINCPARRMDRPYPTLWADSIESTLSGLHCDVLKFDDVVSNTNCQSEQTRVKLRNHIDTTMSVCDTWGKVDMIGTRYFPDDYYGIAISLAQEDPDAHGMKMFVRAAWYVKPEFAHLAKHIKKLEEHMVTLTFPEHASWKFLRNKLKNEYVFRCQYLNEPVWGEENVDLPLDLLRSKVISPLEAQAKRGFTYITGDMAREAKKNSDFSCFVAQRVFQKDDGTICVAVLDVIWDKWTQSEIASNLARFVEKWMPLQIRIEDMPGLESFKSLAIPMAFRAIGLPWHNIYWAPIEQGEGAKRNRIKGLEILLKGDRLFFSNGAWNEETFSRLSQYKGQASTRTRKDDIPDAMSFISKYLPSTVPMSPEQQEQEAARKEQEIATKLLWDQHRFIFGGDSQRVYVPPTVDYEPPAPTDPISQLKKRLFGNNGLR